MYLAYIIDNLMPRCVARNPKDIVRQVAAAKELDSAKVGEPTGAVLCNWCSYIFIKSKRINRTIFQQIVALSRPT